MESNLSNQTIQSNISETKNSSSTYLIGGFTALIITCGLFANALTIRVIWKTRSLHTTTNYLLANLALSDFLTLFFGIPNGVVVILKIHPQGVAGKCLCIFLTAGNPVGTTSMASILTLCFLAVERYHAIVKPMAHGRRLTLDTMKWAFSFIWSVPLIITLPLYISTTFNKKIQFCDRGWGISSEITYILANMLLLFVIPFVLIVTCYTAIIKEMYFSAKVEATLAVRGQDARSRKKLIKVLLVVTSLFLICFGTFSCAWLLYKVQFIGVLHYNAAVQCLFVQSCVNPVIYIFQSTNYREALVAMLKCSKGTVHESREQLPPVIMA